MRFDSATRNPSEKGFIHNHRMNKMPINVDDNKVIPNYRSFEE